MPEHVLEAFKLMAQLQERCAAAQAAGFLGRELDMYVESADEAARLFGLAFYRHWITDGEGAVL